MENERVEMRIEAVIVEIAKLKILPGEILVLRITESWTPRQIALFNRYFDELMSEKFPGIKTLVLPRVEMSILAQVESQDRVKEREYRCSPPEAGPA